MCTIPVVEVQNLFKCWSLLILSSRMCPLSCHSFSSLRLLPFLLLFRQLLRVLFPGKRRRRGSISILAIPSSQRNELKYIITKYEDRYLEITFLVVAITTITAIKSSGISLLRSSASLSSSKTLFFHLFIELSIIHRVPFPLSTVTIFCPVNSVFVTV